MDKDLDRTFKEQELFQKTKTIAELKEVLLTWSLANRALGYRQGMNELVGIFYLVRHEQLKASEQFQTLSAEYKELIDPAFSAHDVFTVFDLLMYTGVESLYAHEDMFKKTKKPSSNQLPGRIFGFLADEYNVISN